MGSFFRHRFLIPGRKRLALYLAFAWLIGLLLGSVLALLSAPLHASLMRRGLCLPVSISGLLTILYLPLLCSAFAVYISQNWLLIPISLFKAITFSFVAVGCSLLQPSGSWLLRLFLMFSGSFSLPGLYWFWYCGCNRGRNETFKAGVIVSVLFLLFGILDYRYISPFLLKLMI